MIAKLGQLTTISLKFMVVETIVGSDYKPPNTTSGPHIPRPELDEHISWDHLYIGFPFD